GLNEMFVDATKWVKKSLDFNKDQSVSFFETTIRCLGGLMANYDLTKNKVFGRTDVSSIQYWQWISIVGSKFGHVSDQCLLLSILFICLLCLCLLLIISNIQQQISGSAHAAFWTGGSLLLAEVGTIQLEFKSCADRSNTPSLAESAVGVFKKMDPMRGGPSLPLRGQYPIFIDSNRVQYRNGHITWGAMGDSFYEYLLKYYLYEGKKDEYLKKMYIESVEGMLEHLYQKNKHTGLYFIAEWEDGRLDLKMDELACFSGGLLALGVMHEVLENDDMVRRHTDAAKQLAETCYQMFSRVMCAIFFSFHSWREGGQGGGWLFCLFLLQLQKKKVCVLIIGLKQQKSGLSPEFMRYSEGEPYNGVDFYILRPETLETMFYLWRLTGDNKWREYGWNIFQSIENIAVWIHQKGVDILQS
ncbi:hypothetical protein RFI_25381, partial [Reticulomyxa filosa]